MIEVMEESADRKKAWAQNAATTMVESLDSLNGSVEELLAARPQRPAVARQARAQVRVHRVGFCLREREAGREPAASAVAQTFD